MEVVLRPIAVIAALLWVSAPLPLAAQDAPAIHLMDWSPVLELMPGTRVTVMGTDLNPVAGAVVGSGPFQLTVLTAADKSRHLMKTIARDNIVEIRTHKKGRGFLGHLGPLGGSFIGGLAGGYLGALGCHCDSGFLPGMVVGGVLGGIGGYRAATRVTDEVIYRAR